MSTTTTTLAQHMETRRTALAFFDSNLVLQKAWKIAKSGMRTAILKQITIDPGVGPMHLAAKAVEVYELENQLGMDSYKDKMDEETFAKFAKTSGLMARMATLIVPEEALGLPEGTNAMVVDPVDRSGLDSADMTVNLLTWITSEPPTDLGVEAVVVLMKMMVDAGASMDELLALMSGQCICGECQDKPKYVPGSDNN